MKKHIVILAIATGLMAYGYEQTSTGNQASTTGPCSSGSQPFRIALVTPASAIDSAVIDSARLSLERHGLQPVVMSHAYGQEYGSYSATDTLRAADLMAAFADDSIDAVMCTRGGYGAVRLLPLLDAEVIRAHPKWLIGYSDITALHAYLTTQVGIKSLHAPMAAHLAEEPDTVVATELLFDFLHRGLPVEYTVDTCSLNNLGIARGKLVGGNLSVLNGLGNTPYDPLTVGSDSLILFIEDVGEKTYAVERMLHRLHLSGSLDRVAGIIVGQFTKSGIPEDFDTPEQMIAYWLRRWGYYDRGIPVAYGFPVGHVTDNYPMVCEAMATLEVSDEGVRLRME